MMYWVAEENLLERENLKFNVALLRSGEALNRNFLLRTLTC